MTVLQIAIAALCFVWSWASVKWNMNMEMWGDLSFYELWVFLPEHVAGMIVVICSAAAVLLVWTPLKRIAALPLLIQTFIVLKTRFEVTHDIAKRATGYQEANMLPLGNIHCIIVILALVICTVVNNLPKERKS